MSVQGDLRINIDLVLTKAADLGTARFPVSLDDVTRVTPGTGAKQADKLFTDTRTLAASAQEDIDLAGALTDNFGAAMSFAEVMAIYIKARAENTNNVVVGGASSNAFAGPFADASDKIVLKPGASVLIKDETAAGWAVTAGTGDLLRIANSGSGTSVTYDIVIVGRSA